MFESILSESSRKPLYKLIPQNETITEWNTADRNKIIESDEMTDINLSAMDFGSYSVSKIRCSE